MRDGWLSYVNDPAPGNVLMRGMNKTMDARTFDDSAAAQRPLIVGEKDPRRAIGSMTKQRWQTLIKQLTDLKVIEKAPAAEECFVEPAPQ